MTTDTTNKKILIATLIKNCKEGLSIQDIAVKTNIDRNTIRIILAELLGSKMIRQQIRGNLKLNFWIPKDQR